MSQTQERSQTLQSTVLNQLRRQKVPVTIHLVNGIKLQGSISAFDQFSILLRRGDRQRLVYKHAITTVEPGRPVSLDQGAERAAEGRGKAPGPRHPAPGKGRPAAARKAGPAPSGPPAEKEGRPAEAEAPEPAPPEPPAPEGEGPADGERPGAAPGGGEGPEG